jgi:hypothetical protein
LYKAIYNYNVFCDALGIIYDCKTILGIELERTGAPADPVEGSDVTLICSTAYDDMSNRPVWFYHVNDNYSLFHYPEESNSTNNLMNFSEKEESETLFQQRKNQKW